MSRLLVMLAVVGGLLPASRGSAQTPSQANAPPAPAPSHPSASDDVLPGLPEPLDEPRSLLQPAPAAPPYRCDPLPGRYFERDPLLDPPQWPQPGWFGDVEVGIVAAHFKNRMTDTVTVDGLMPNTVHLPTAELDWTASPRVEVGYRLPSGWGDIALSYRFLSTSGSETGRGADGPFALQSRLDVHIASLDYISREMSLWPNCGMRWRFGLRFASVYFDSQANEPFAEAAGGSGIFATRTSSHFKGIGPHLGVQLERKLGWQGLALVAAADGASLVGRTRQNFFEATTTLGPDGQPLVGEHRLSNPQTVPVLNLQVGVGWEPPAFPHSHIFLGYEYEYWWDTARVSFTFSRGEMSDQGFLLRAEFNF
jgi:hypothetical protein